MVYGLAWGFGGTMQWLFYYAVRILKALIWPSLKVVVSKLWQIQGTRFCVVKRIMINSWEKQNCSGLEFEYGLSGLMWNIGFYLRHWGHHKDQRGSYLRENSGKNILHLQPYHLFGFCLDCYIESQNSLDRSKLRPSQTPTNHPSEFFGHITFSVPNIKL